MDKVEIFYKNGNRTKIDNVKSVNIVKGGLIVTTPFNVKFITIKNMNKIDII